MGKTKTKERMQKSDAKKKASSIILLILFFN